MPSYVFKQPNGLYGEFSTVVDTVTAYDLTAEQIIRRFRHCEKCTCGQSQIDHADGRVALGDSPYRRYHTIPECINTIRAIHGRREATKVAKLLGVSAGATA